MAVKLASMCFLTFRHSASCEDEFLHQRRPQDFLSDLSSTANNQKIMLNDDRKFLNIHYWPGLATRNTQVVTVTTSDLCAHIRRIILLHYHCWFCLYLSWKRKFGYNQKCQSTKKPQSIDPNTWPSHIFFVHLWTVEKGALVALCRLSHASNYFT